MAHSVVPTALDVVIGHSQLALSTCFCPPAADGFISPTHNSYFTCSQTVVVKQKFIINSAEGQGVLQVAFSQKRKKLNRVHVIPTIPVCSISPLIANILLIKIQREFWEQGFVNIKKKVRYRLGKRGISNVSFCLFSNVIFLTPLLCQGGLCESPTIVTWNVPST